MPSQSYSQLLAHLANELFRENGVAGYRELETVSLPAALTKSLRERSESVVSAEFERLFSAPHFDSSRLDADTLQQLREILLDALTIRKAEVEEAIEKSANSFTGGWSTEPLDLRTLETDPRGFSVMIFERARALGFHQVVLELGVLATVFDLSEAKVLADVLRLEESLDPHPVEIDELALILERYTILRREYVVARKMQSGGTLGALAKLEEQIAPPPPAPETAPAPLAQPVPTVTAEPVAPAAPPEPEKPLRPVTAKPPENRYELQATWRDTFLDPKIKQSLMNALRTKNAAAYDEWVEKVSQQTVWKVARIHIDNYLYVYGIERGTVLWERVMKTSIPFFPDAPSM